MRRLLLVTIVALLATLLPLGPLSGTAVGASADPVAAEGEFVARINALRQSKGLAPLALHSELVALGRSWSTTMADADRIWHNPNLAGSVSANWTKLGENVGVGGSVGSLFDAFVASPSHYKNLVDGSFTHIGVGVVIGRDGALFTAHQFMTLAAAAPAPAPAPAPKPAAGTPRPAPAPAVASPAPVPPAPPTPPARITVVLEQLRALDAA